MYRDGFNIYRSKEFEGLPTRAKTILDTLGFRTKQDVITSIKEGIYLGWLPGIVDLGEDWYKYRRLGIVTYNQIRVWAGFEPLPTRIKQLTVVIRK
jgi:hypothetical protein